MGEIGLLRHRKPFSQYTCVYVCERKVFVTGNTQELGMNDQVTV